MIEANEDFITKMQAEQLATAINLLFNNSVFFGAGHPSIIAAADDLACKVADIGCDTDMVTLAKTGESFYIDKWCVDHRLNVDRTRKQFSKCHLQSISFTPQCTGAQIQTFLQFYEETLMKSQDADTISSKLQQLNIHDVLVNYVTYQKVTKDQQIVAQGEGTSSFSTPQEARPRVANNRDEATGSYFGAGAASGVVDSTIYNRLNQLFSLNDIASGGVSDKLIQMISGEADASNGNSYGLPNLTDQFKRLRLNIDQTELSQGEHITYDQLFESLIEMTDVLKQNKELQERLIKLDGAGEFTSEVDNLTYEAILGIIREEYKKENPSLKRLAFLVKRVSPSQVELRRLMPRMKQALLVEGMHLTDFLELSIEIEREFSADSAMQNLFEHSDDYGVDRDELISAIRTNPGETAKLLLQAAEIEKRVVGQNINISDYLGEMINDVAKNAASERVGTDGMPGQDIHTILSNVVETVERQVISRLRETSSGSELSEEVQQQLKTRFPKTLNKLKTEWIVNTLNSAETMNSDGLLTILNSVVKSKEDIDTYKGALQMFSEKFGLSNDEISMVLASAKQQKVLEERKKELPLLPPKITVHFIKRYIEEYRRYNHPFGIVVLSDSRDDVKYASDILLSLSESISLMMTEQFRLLDITGFLRLRGKDFAVVILPMTGKKGLVSLLTRMTQHLEQQAHSELVVSSLSFEEPMKPLSYEDAMKQLLKDHIKG